MSEESELPRPMSVANVLHKLSPPKLFVANLPMFKQSFVTPHMKLANATSNQSTAARYVEWKNLFPRTNLSTSFSELFTTTRFGSTGCPPRLTFFGEQHHQPSVLHAQLQLLYSLHQTSQKASVSPTVGKHFKLHLILEHFSILDQGLLDSFARTQMNAQEFAQAYEKNSDEGFSAAHYLPLLILAKELDVPVWGGFPPRSWAKLVNKKGIEGAKAEEQKRLQSKDVAGRRVPEFMAWDTVTNLSAAHRSYLSSLRRPDVPPVFPSITWPRAEKHETNPTQEDQPCAATYPTWFIPPPQPESQGFGPSQALKDAYLAHVTSWVLCQPVSIGEVNIALVICGLGHCEYGFGAPDRVVQYLEDCPSVSDEVQKIRPLIIASKAVDSGVWLRSDSDENDSSEREFAEDGTFSKGTWLNDVWARRVADAVVLYEWSDPGPKDDTSKD